MGDVPQASGFVETSPGKQDERAVLRYPLTLHPLPRWGEGAAASYNFIYRFTLKC